eukprot:EG_transcript_8802
MVFVFSLCSAKIANQLYAVGANSYGQLADGSYVDRALAVRMVPGWGSTVPVIAQGGFKHTVVLAGNDLFVVGDNNNGELAQNRSGGSSTTFVRMTPAWSTTALITHFATGYDFTVVVAGGTLFAVGDNSYGQLGDNSNVSRAAFVRMIPVWGTNRTVEALSAGRCNTVVLAGGSLFSVGNNWYGQLGDGTTNSSNIFVSMAHTWGSNPVVAMSYGSWHVVILTGGQVFGVGENYSGQLGDGTTTQKTTFIQMPAAWNSTVSVTAIAAGVDHTIVLAGNVLYSAGTNTFGVLGINNTDDPPLVQPGFVRTLPAWGPGARVAAIVAGESHSVALVDGVVYSVGFNRGVIGDNTTINRPVFTRMIPTWGNTINVTTIWAGKFFTMVLAGSMTATPTITTTISPSRTASSTGTRTLTPTPTRTRTRTGTASPSPTATGSNTRPRSCSETATGTRTLTPTPTRTRTRTGTASPSPTVTGSNTRPRSCSETATGTRTLTPTPTRTRTRTGTASPSPTVTGSNTRP